MCTCGIVGDTYFGSVGQHSAIFFCGEKKLQEKKIGNFIGEITFFACRFRGISFSDFGQTERNMIVVTVFTLIMN